MCTRFIIFLCRILDSIRSTHGTPATTTTTFAMIKMRRWFPGLKNSSKIQFCLHEKPLEVVNGDRLFTNILHLIYYYSKYDLYTKCTEVPDIAALKPYYQSLIDKYIPGILEW
jgi:hypothetical protein